MPKQQYYVLLQNVNIASTSGRFGTRMAKERELFQLQLYYLSLQGERDKYNLTTTPLKQFNYRFQIMFMIPTPRSSTCVEAIAVNPFTATAVLRFTKNGYEYKYSNVSRKKILNLLLNPNMSFGFWVQDLVKNAVLEFNDEVRNTGKLSYKLIGATYNSKQALQLAQLVRASGSSLAVQLRKDAVD